MTKMFSRKFGIQMISLAATLGLLLVSCVHSVSAANDPSKGHLITIYDRGIEKSIISEKSTLREAFKEANIAIDTHDRVEPGLDEPLVAQTYQVNVYRARPIVIVDGVKQVRVMSAYQTPKQIAKAAGIALHDEDNTTVAPTNDIINDGASERLIIDRATPVEMVLYGKTETVYTQKTTVGALLKSKNITPGKEDTVSVAADAAITPGMRIEIWRNGKQTLTQEEPVQFETETIKDANQEVGYRKVTTPGVAGKKTVTYEVEMRNGQEISRKEVQSVVITQPTKEVVVVGAKMTNTFSGDFAGALARLRSCEGSYTSNTGNGYYGAYQYDLGTWANYQGYPNAAAAPPAVQDQKAWETYQRRGWQPWPSCSRSQGLQDIYR